MNKQIEITNNLGFCKECFNDRRNGSKYCGNCKTKQFPIYQDNQKNHPLFKKIAKKFPITKGTILTYGDTIYFDGELPFHLIRHEITHCIQQKNPKEWWDKYFNDVKFRLSQELEAYRNQYRVAKNNLVLGSQILTATAKDLSSDLYGGIISFEEAKKQIKN